MMLALGPYPFSLNTSAYQSLKRNSEYRWPSTPRIGQEPLLQVKVDPIARTIFDRI